MNKGYTYIDGMVIISDGNGNHTQSEYYDNLEKVLVQKNVIEAMENAKLLVKLCVKAGYKKIHLDTSMRLGDDPVDQPLLDSVIAERGAILFKECENAYQEMLQNNPDEIRPVYVIGSEVPIPGGSQEVDDRVSVTKPEDFENTLLSYKK